MHQFLPWRAKEPLVCPVILEMILTIISHSSLALLKSIVNDNLYYVNPQERKPQAPRDWLDLL